MERIRRVATTAAHNWLSGRERKLIASVRAYAILPPVLLAACRTDARTDGRVRKRENKSGGENTTSERASERTNELEEGTPFQSSAVLSGISDQLGKTVAKRI